MKSWLPGKKRGGAREGSERKQLAGKRSFTYGKFVSHRVPALYCAEDAPEDHQ